MPDGDPGGSRLSVVDRPPCRSRCCFERQGRRAHVNRGANPNAEDTAEARSRFHPAAAVQNQDCGIARNASVFHHQSRDTSPAGLQAERISTYQSHPCAGEGPGASSSLRRSDTADTPAAAGDRPRLRVWIVPPALQRPGSTVRLLLQRLSSPTTLDGQTVAGCGTDRRSTPRIRASGRTLCGWFHPRSHM